MAKLDIEARLAELKAKAEAAPDTSIDKGRETKPKAKPAKPKPKPKAAPAPGRAVANSKQALALRAQMFAHAYVRSGCNATAAYLETHPGVTPATAAQQGMVWLRKAQTQAVLAPLLEGLMQKNEVDTEFVLSRLLEQANASPLDYFTIDEGGWPSIDMSAVNDAQRRNLRSVKITENTTVNNDGEERTTRSVTVTVVDQQKAIEMFAKYLKMFTQELAEEDLGRIGDMIEAGVKRIRANKDLDAWRTIDGEFSEVG